jgi:ATP-dependent helicase HepA
MDHCSNAASKRSYPFAAGQRWISTAEPELGLGTIVACAQRRVEISFATHAEVRTYAVDTAPLQRILFSPGNTVENTSGRRYIITGLEEDPQSHLVTYRCGDVSLREDALSDTIAFSTPHQRFAAGIVDDHAAFELRGEMLRFRLEIDATESRGFTGGRIDLIPHQLFIAQKVTSAPAVRVLLADETGLGKTIEACLILHRMLLTGQVTRALILVPEALVHQWFVELLRRFNILCRLVTVDAGDKTNGTDFFKDDPLWICSIEAVRTSPDIANQLDGAAWEIVIVDEVHHIAAPDPVFMLLESLAVKSRSLVFLSATPEQFGRKEHFTRLRLLDPNRYREPEPATAEAKRLRLIAACLERQIRKSPDLATPDEIISLSDDLLAFLTDQLPPDVGRPIPAIQRTMSIAHLIDLFGAGRAYFRNTRRTIAGFPKRSVSIVRLGPAGITGDNPHAKWLSGFLKRHPRRKVLAITATTEKAVALRDMVQKAVAVDVALFNESMALIQRDRQAAWFAEENGARMLICSESGSEGRNFQFCSDLALFELPWNPELLEQRIGRLDRIGQKRTINLHVPVVTGSAEEALCRWYHEGVNAFEKNVPAAAMVFEEMRPQLERLTAAPSPDSGNLERIIGDTRQRTAALSAELFERRDFLLEFASNNRRQAQGLIDTIERLSAGGRLPRTMDKLFDHYGIKLEEAGGQRFALITEYCTDDAFPLPRSERPVITYDRATACSHDTIEFLTIDHPMVTGALDLYLSSPHGTSSFALWNDPKTTELLLESLYVAECIAPAHLRISRFFNTQPLRTVVDHHRRLVTDAYPPSFLAGRLVNGPVRKLVDRKQLMEEIFPRMIEDSDSFANKLIVPLIESARAAMHESYAVERERLIVLRSQGAPLSPEEIALLENEEQEIEICLSASRIRRDSLRFIWRGAFPEPAHPFF